MHFRFSEIMDIPISNSLTSNQYHSYFKSINKRTLGKLNESKVSSKSKFLTFEYGLELQ